MATLMKENNWGWLTVSKVYSIIVMAGSVVADVVLAKQGSTSGFSDSGSVSGPLARLKHL